MPDFNVQHISGTIDVSAGDTVTLTAGTDYVAPTVAANARVVIRSNNACGDGMNGSGFGGGDDWMVCCNNPGNIATSLTFELGVGSTDDVTFRAEIIEYTGAGGGNNEVELLGTEVLSLGTSDLTADTSVYTPSADANIVVEVAGQCMLTASARGNINGGLHTGDWIGASNLGRVTRDVTGSELSNCHVNVLDHSGANWNIQRVENDFVGTTAETQTITAVGSLARAFCIFRQRGSTANTTGRNVAEAWLSATDEVSFHTDQVAGGNVCAAYVIENTDTSGDAMNVQRVSGFELHNQGNPHSHTETITAVDSLATASVTGLTARTTSGTHTDSYKGQIGAQLTATTTVTLYQGNSQENRNYRFEVTEWPDTSTSAHTASGSPSISAITASGQGDITRSGSGAVSIPAITAAGVAETVVTAAGAVSIPALTATGVGRREIQASGAVSIPAISASGAAQTGEAVYNASGDVSIPSITASGQAEPGREASGDVSIPAITASGIGFREAKVTFGDVSIPAVTAAGAARVEQFASGDVFIPSIVAAGVGVVGGVIIASPWYGTGYIIDIELNGVRLTEGDEIEGRVIDLTLEGRINVVSD